MRLQGRPLDCGPMGYLKAFHVAFLFIWLGGLMGLSRFLGYHVAEDAHTRERLTRIERRIYFFVTLPGAIMAISTGFLLLMGVGRDMETAQALRYYMVPSAPENVFWRATFHAKLTSVALLIGCDIFTLTQILKLARGGEMPSRLRFSILHGVEALLLIVILILMYGQPMVRS